MGGPPPRVRRPPSARPRRDGPGHARAPLAPRAGSRRGQRHGRRDAPAGGRRPGRAHRHPHGAGLPPRPRRHRADRRPGPGLGPRHEPRHGLHGRLPDGQHPLGPRRRRGPGAVPGRPGADDRRGDDHQPLHPRALRAAGRGAPRDGPRRGRPGLHGRGQPQRPARPLPARRRRLRRHALQRPQDVLHAPRRGAGREPDPSGSAPTWSRSCPSRSCCASRTARSAWSG